MKAVSFSSLYTLKYLTHLGYSIDVDEGHTIKKKTKKLNFSIYPFAYPEVSSFYDTFISSYWRFTICWKNTFTV